MTVVGEVLAAHVPADADEATDVARVAAMVAAAADPWSRSVPMHLTASALVIHPPTRRVLLRWHAKAHRWLQVGGHGDPGESDPWLIALREAREETALTDLRPWPGPDPRLAQVAIVDVNATPAEPAHEHADLRYLFATDTPDAVPAEVEGVPLQWCTAAAAIELADEWLARLIRVVERTHP